MKRWACICATIVLLLPANAAFAWGSDCRWSGTGLITVPVAIHCPSFGPYGFDCNSVTAAVKLASVPWNTETGVNVRLGLPSLTSTWTPVSGTVLIRMDPENGDPNVVAVAYHDAVCGQLSYIILYGNQGWTLDLPTSGRDMVGELGHDLGHMLGLHDWNASGTCASGSNTSPAPMAMMNPTRNLDSRQIATDDITALRTGACAYPAFDYPGKLQIRKSTDGGNTWTTDTTLAVGSNIAPAIAGGIWSGANVYGYARVDNARNVQATLGGVTTNLGSSLTGPAMAFGNGLWVVAFAQSSGASDGLIRVCRQPSTGGGWTCVNSNMVTGLRPAVAWNQSDANWWFAFAQWNQTTSTTYPNENLLVETSTNLMTFGTPVQAYGAFGQGHFAAAGPAIVCPQAVWECPASFAASSPPLGDTGACFVVAPDARSDGQTFRQVVMGRLFTGFIGNNTSSTFQFPAWGGRFVASRFDIAATFDPHANNVVYAFREGNSLQTADVGEFKARDLTTATSVPPNMACTVPAPPPGFENTSPPGFATGGSSNSNTWAGIAVTTLPAVGGNYDNLYEIGHVP